MFERVMTYIPGFDALIDGGIPKGSLVLLSGSAGAGKTIFALQYLYNGAMKNSERGLYLSFEESKESIMLQAKVLGWDLEHLESKGLIRVESISLSKNSMTKANKLIETAVADFKPQRLVFDSISIFGIFAEFITDVSALSALGVSSKDNIILPRSEIMTRKAVAEVIDNISKMGATSIIISELPVDSKWLSRDTISEFLVDGVVKLEYSGGDSPRAITVAKMRKTKIDNCARPFDLTEEGIKIYGKEKVYSKKS